LALKRANCPFSKCSSVNGPEPTPSRAWYFVIALASCFSQMCLGSTYMSSVGSLGSTTDERTTSVFGSGAEAVRFATTEV
jgi:hypothetical protein